ETGWKQAGARRWLWAGATVTVAFFVIHARRNWEGLKALLGEAITGVVCSDRWATYDRLPPERRQVCWAHTIRTQSTIQSISRCRLWRIPRSMPRPRRLIWARA